MSMLSGAFVFIDPTSRYLWVVEKGIQPSPRDTGRTLSHLRQVCSLSIHPRVTRGTHERRQNIWHG